MPCRLRFFSFAIAMLVFCFPFGSAQAQAGSGSHARSVVTQNIDEEKLVTLHGNTRPEAKAEHDQGAVDDNLVLEHMLLQLRRPAEQDAELQEFLEDLNKEGSPNFHRWISAHEFGERFGPSDRDLDKLTNWLEAHRFKVNVVYPSGMVIDFTGTAGQVRKAFHTEMHQLDVKGQKHFANMRNAQIPAALAPLVVGIVSLHNFSPHALHQMRHQFTFPDPFGGTTFALVPADLATFARSLAFPVIPREQSAPFIRLLRVDPTTAENPAFLLRMTPRPSWMGNGPAPPPQARPSRWFRVRIPTSHSVV